MTAQDLITEILQTLKEPSGLLNGVTGGPQPHWPRTEILQRMNLQQDKISGELPTLFQATDSTLVTTGTNAGLPVPTYLGNIRDVQIGGVTITRTSREQLVAMSQTGEVEDTWQNTAGTAGLNEDMYWFTEIDNTGTNGAEGMMLYFYPFPIAGSIVTLQADLILSNMTDANNSYSMADVPYLSKAQEILIKLTAMWCAMEDSRTDLYELLNQEVYGAEGLMKKLRKNYLVLRSNPQPSALQLKRSEDTGSRPEYMRVSSPNA